MSERWVHRDFSNSMGWDDPETRARILDLAHRHEFDTDMDLIDDETGELIMRVSWWKFCQLTGLFQEQEEPIEVEILEMVYEPLKDRSWKRPSREKRRKENKQKQREARK